MDGGEFQFKKEGGEFISTYRNKERNREREHGHGGRRNQAPNSGVRGNPKGK